MNGLTIALLLVIAGLVAAWWRTEGQLDRTRQHLHRARYRIAQDRLRMRQLAAERDRAIEHADTAQAALTAFASGERHLHVVEEQA